MSNERLKLKQTNKPLERESLYDRIDKKADTDACWPWLYGTTARGYGHFYRRNEHIYAHREAYEIAFGPIPDGLHVLHRCDNPPCCNPNHLFLGTHSENMADMVRKGRLAPRERLPQTKFARSDLNAAIDAVKAGEKPKVVAQRYGMTASYLRALANGKKYRGRHESRSLPAAPIPPACSSSF